MVDEIQPWAVVKQDGEEVSDPAGKLESSDKDEKGS